MPIRSDFDLPTLRILIDPERTSFTEAVFQVLRGDNVPREVARCSLRDLGLPDTLTGVRQLKDDLLNVPEMVMAPLQQVVSGMGPSPLPPESALWLEFPSPRGFLYIAPWERLLEKLGRSLFRLPNHLVRPQARGRRLDVAICASVPKAKEPFEVPRILEPLAHRYLRLTGHDVTVHVFTDGSCLLPVQDLFKHWPSQVVVHDPLKEAASYEPTPGRAGRIGAGAQLSNPWLLWMRDAMDGKRLDFVHFVGHGYLSGGRGAIAVAESPTVSTDPKWSRFIGSVEMNTFLSQVGAWGLVLTGPYDNFCEAGLRELADAIALIRPGVAMTHDIKLDPYCEQMELALRTILGLHAPLDRPLPATTCWVHPRFVEFPDEYRATLADNDAATWVASASRVLETQQMRWLPDSTDVSPDPAAVRALRNVADLVERHVSQAYLPQALAATPPDHPDRPGNLTDLGNALLTRFQRTGDTADLDRAIDLFAQAVAATPGDHPDRPMVLSNLGTALQARFERTGDTADLDRAIDLREQAITTTAHPAPAASLSALGNALRARFERTGSTLDLDRAISLGEEAVATTPPDHPTRPGNLTNLGNALLTRFQRTGDTADLDRAIDLFAQAVAATTSDHPDRPMVLSNLGTALQARFERTGDTADLDGAISLREQAITTTAHLAPAASLSALGNALRARFERTGSAADLDRAIILCEQAVATTPPDHPNRPTLLSNLGNALGTRFQRTGCAADLDRAISLGEEAVATTPPDHPTRPGYLSNLGSALRTRFERSGSSADLDRAIDLFAQAVATTSPDHPNRPTLLSNLGYALGTRFQRTGRAADLDGAINLFEEAVAATPADHPNQPSLLSNLGTALRIRFELGRGAADLERALGVFRYAAGVVAGPVVVRARAARQWGQLAVAARDWAKAVDGFGAAVALAGLAVPWELGRADQMFRSGEFAGLGSEAAAACVQAGQPARAVELFEQGRAVMFSQVLDSRSDLTDLQRAYPDVAERFERCRDVLDRPDTYLVGPGDIDPGTAPRLDADARQAAATEFEQVLTDIRTKPGFERFLAPRQLTELLPAAADGPVVLLNIAALRSDALILTTDDVAVLPLPGVDPDQVIEQANTFLQALAEVRGVASLASRSGAAQALAGVLGWLSDRITGPVLDHLGYTSTPPAGEQWPRVWWCPAGVLSVLPIHAAGHHDLSSQRPDAVIDRVISSTIPTLRALVHARAAPVNRGKPYVLVVAMPHTPNQTDLPGAAQEAAALQQLWNPRVTVLGLSDTDPATYAAVTANLPDHPWVHFACHSQSDLANPWASYLQLADRRLTVIDLTDTRLTHAELAFLSASTTARTSTQLPEEPIHLSAGCQLAGYRHVVAPLWDISDADAAWLAKHFYTTLKSTSTDATANALHQATRELRAIHRPRPDLWAPYTHTGP